MHARALNGSASLTSRSPARARWNTHVSTQHARDGLSLTSTCTYDGVSGAESANRPGFVRLMNALKPRPPFQVLVMSEELRLEREAIETAYALRQLAQAGVRVFSYLKDRERTLDSPTDKIVLSLTAFADELAREKGSPAAPTMRCSAKAKAGYVTGGRVFGYDNVEVLGPEAIATGICLRGWRR